MGTTSDKLTYLNETKTKIKDAINLTGANITNDTFRSYASTLKDNLLNIWTNGADVIFTNWGTKVNGEGTTLQLTDTINARMKLTLKGNTTQASTPTPSTPVNVNVVSGDNEINITTKNLLNCNSFTTTTQYGVEIKPIFNNGLLEYINVNGVFNSNANQSIQIGTFEATQGTTYYMSGLTGWNYNTLQLWGDNGTVFPAGNRLQCYNGIRSAVAQASGIVPIKIFMYVGQTYNNVKIYPMITLTNDDKYIPYQSQSYNIKLGTIELCKISTYQDYIYKDSGKWYLHKEVGKFVANNDLASNGDTSNYVSLLSPVLDITASMSGGDLGALSYCNVMATTFGSMTNYSGLNGTTSSKMIRVNISKSYATDSATANTFLTNNNFTIYYVLSTPTNTEITNTTLINQLENLRGAMSYEGQTNISGGFMIVGASALGELS